MVPGSLIFNEAGGFTPLSNKTTDNDFFSFPIFIHVIFLLFNLYSSMLNILEIHLFSITIIVPVSSNYLFQMLDPLFFVSVSCLWRTFS